MPKRKDHKWITGHLNVIRDRGNWLENLEKIDGVDPAVLAEINEFVERCSSLLHKNKFCESKGMKHVAIYFKRGNEDV